MSWWLNENFSLDYAREKFSKDEQVLMLVLHYCYVCDQLLAEIPPQGEWQRHDVQTLETYIKHGIYVVNQKGNLVVHRKLYKCKTCE